MVLQLISRHCAGTSPAHHRQSFIFLVDARRNCTGNIFYQLELVVISNMTGNVAGNVAGDINGHIAGHILSRMKRAYNPAL
jgi:hypothetical protein